MVDKLTPEQRHRCMSHIRSKDTKPEILVRKYLFARGYRYRLHCKKLPGHPDLVLRKYKTVIFVNGCFWHGHENCKYFVLPKSNTDFWEKKINRNKVRDAEEQNRLRMMGWHVVLLWECQLKPSNYVQTLKALEYLLNKTFLEDHQRRWRPHTYETATAPETQQVAEETTDYGATPHQPVEP